MEGTERGRSVDKSPRPSSVDGWDPHVVCLALIVSGWTVLRALAPAAKACAVIPMIAECQWRAVALFTTAAALSVVILWPLWSQYAKDYIQAGSPP
jgi:hypothetical protein